MMKFLLATLLFVSTAAVTLSALAASTNPVLVTGIEVDASSGGTPRVRVQFAAELPNSGPTCATSSWALVDTTLSPDALRALTSQATAAFLSGKPVRVNWLPTCPGGNTYGTINDVILGAN